MRNYDPLTTTAVKVYTGLIVRQTPDSLQLRTPKQTELNLPSASIDQTQPSPLSIMPQDLDRILSPGDFADLVAYLKSMK